MEFHPLLKYGSILFTKKKKSYTKNSLGCHFPRRRFSHCVFNNRSKIMATKKNFSKTIICWYYSRYSLVRYRLLVRFHRFFRGFGRRIDIGPHLFTCLGNWTIFDGSGRPRLLFGSNVFNFEWKVRECWSHGKISVFEQRNAVENSEKILSF